ncbi:helix-turn-helix domain-containing protein [Christiangramia salexigens]|uniref:Transcriptional regulator n=1 Tax=Christiangramia salexigens TaxID=1913577 RepID=A0A1L3J3F3_9FLAO|nr:helix-turn-helix transcriptional regulator [Christiangramia salexigens]APG59640.1 transcriptional regulator [Christiangramia salexigens]
MVNTNQFASRLNKILDFYDLSAASFADKIEVGRSSISHILSGRNKPSLDFVMKVIKNFPEVELYWLLNGKGSFPPKPDSKIEIAEESKQEINEPVKKPESQIENIERNQPANYIPQGNGKQIRKIVIFYEDGSFEAFQN